MTRATRALAVLADQIVACRACPRLIDYLAEFGQKRKREFADCEYWARPLPGWGDPAARVLLVGLAPAAHGGARTGRVFTGDSSGAFLSAALWRAGFASQPSSTDRNDGLVLHDAWIGLVGRCAPPDNKPLPDELARCRHFLVDEMTILAGLRVIVALGEIAFDAIWQAAPQAGFSTVTATTRRPEFGHGAEVMLTRGAKNVLVVGSYHPSRQNTQTGRLTPAMLDEVLARARRML